MVCLIGASGASKSMLLRRTDLLEFIEDSDICCDGETFPSVNPAHIRCVPELACVSELQALFTQTTIENTMLVPLRVPNKTRDYVRDETETLFARFGFADRMWNYTDQL